MLFDSICISFFLESARYIWSGFNDLVKEDTYVCSTGARVTRSFFYPGGPTGGTIYNCVRFQVQFNFLLVDTNCASNQMILCEKDAQ